MSWACGSRFLRSSALKNDCGEGYTQFSEPGVAAAASALLRSPGTGVEAGAVQRGIEDTSRSAESCWADEGGREEEGAGCPGRGADGLAFSQASRVEWSTGHALGPASVLVEAVGVEEKGHMVQVMGGVGRAWVYAAMC